MVQEKRKEKTPELSTLRTRVPVQSTLPISKKHRPLKRTLTVCLWRRKKNKNRNRKQKQKQRLTVMKEVDGAVSIVEKKKKESKRLQSFHNRRAKQKSSTAFWGPMKEPAPRFWFPPFSHAGQQYSSCLVFCKYKKKKNRCQLVAICKPLWAETRESAYVTKRQTRTSGNTHTHKKRQKRYSAER